MPDKTLQSKTFHKNILVNIEVYADFRVLSPPRPKLFLYFTKKLTVKSAGEFSDGIHGFSLRTKIFRSFIFPERSPLIEAWAVPNVVDFQSFVGFINLLDFNIVQLCTFFVWISLLHEVVCGKFVQNRFGSFISLFGLSAILKIRCFEHTISGRARLEPGKTNVRRKGERVWYVWVIDQVWGQDGWILAKSFFSVFMDRDRVEVHKLAKTKKNLNNIQPLSSSVNSLYIISSHNLTEWATAPCKQCEMDLNFRIGII